ncbi:hypothetical protein DFQ27_005685, partial [Actinomortierella ambigua]
FCHQIIDQLYLRDLKDSTELEQRQYTAILIELNEARSNDEHGHREKRARLGYDRPTNVTAELERIEEGNTSNPTVRYLQRVPVPVPVPAAPASAPVPAPAPLAGPASPPPPLQPPPLCQQQMQQSQQQGQEQQHEQQCQQQQEACSWRLVQTEHTNQPAIIDPRHVRLPAQQQQQQQQLD